MDMVLSDIAKHFGREVVFQGVSLVLKSGSRTAILGPNGSGKSTLLQVIGGIISPTSGSISHKLEGRDVPQETLYRHVSIAAPYLGLYEDLSLEQTVEFHARFKPFRKGVAPVDVARIAHLGHAMGKPVLHFSSGMKQRLKLALAILSDTPLLLLDEPGSNLDAEAIAWFRELLDRHLEGRTLLVASNRQRQEHDMCTGTIEIDAHKPRADTGGPRPMIAPSGP